MKKNLLLLAGALATASWANALENTELPWLFITQVSNDGQYVVSDFYGQLVRLNTTTGDFADLTPDEDDYTTMYAAGLGNYLSNNGVVVLSVDESCHTPYYWDGEQLIALPLRESDMGINLSNAITPDGSRIVGQVGRALWDIESSLMQEPVYWPLLDDGSYGEYIDLPHPTTDFSGRKPQYVTAICVSADGKTILGQVVDFQGYVDLPILYKEDADGNWTYKMLWDTNPNGIELPEAPEYPESPYIYDFMSQEEIEAYEEAVEEYYIILNQQPTLEEFMSEESIAAYQAAVDAYYEDPYTNPYPSNMMDYMTEEEIAAYNAAYDSWQAVMTEFGGYPQPKDFMTKEELTAFDEAMAIYEEKEWAYMEWEEILWGIQESIPAFEFNNVVLSPNGKWAATTAMTFDWWTYQTFSTTYLIDTETGEYQEFTGVTAVVTYVNDEGVMLAFDPNQSAYVGYIRPANSDEFINLTDYMQQNNPSTYDWMKENMEHTYVDWIPDYELGEYVETEVTDIINGIPFADANLNVISCANYNIWNPDEAIIVSYLLNNEANNSIDSIFAEEENAPVRYFDLQGRIVENPAAGQLMIRVRGSKATKVVIK